MVDVIHWQLRAVKYILIAAAAGTLDHFGILF